MRINGLDLFSGIGGIALALHPWVQTVAYCEIEKYPQKVLRANMERGNLDTAPIYLDVTTLKGEDLDHRIDIITAGFPCQDISVAGHGRGLAGERSGLFFQIVRLACELSPRYIFLENVPAITSRGGTAVVAELTKIGYECRWTTLSAKAVGANHKRERWWLLARRLDTHAVELGCSTWALQDLRCEKQDARRAQPCDVGKEASSDARTCDIRNAYHNGCTTTQIPQCVDERGDGCTSESEQTRELAGSSEQHAQLANTDGTGCQELNTSTVSTGEGFSSGCAPSIWTSSWWATEPQVRVLDDGIPDRIPAIKALGNSVVPLQARVAFEYLLKGTTP